MVSQCVYIGQGKAFSRGVGSERDSKSVSSSVNIGKGQSMAITGSEDTHHHPPRARRPPAPRPRVPSASRRW